MLLVFLGDDNKRVAQGTIHKARHREFRRTIEKGRGNCDKIMGMGTLSLLRKKSLSIKGGGTQ